jgi:phosphotransacetylase
MVVGMQKGISTVSSIGIFNIPGYEGSEGSLLAFGDIAVCTNPSAEEIAGIAIFACETVRSLVEWSPRCALLSYSTCGSGEGPLVDKVVEAVKIADERRPDLAIDGEFQLDTAISPKVSEKKVKRESRVAGNANIIVWPDLNVGNVGVKLVQQFAMLMPMTRCFRALQK